MRTHIDTIKYYDAICDVYNDLKIYLNHRIQLLDVFSKNGQNNLFVLDSNDFVDNGLHLNKLGNNKIYNGIVHYLKFL